VPDMDTIKGIAHAARRFSVLLKAAFIAGLVLVLLIPLFVVQAMVAERESRQAGAEAEIIQSRGGEQAVGGPVLTIPFVVRTKDDKGQLIESTDRLHVLPDSLVVEGTVDAERRRRGIYEAVTYDTTLRVSGQYTVPDFAAWRVAPRDVLWDEAILSVELPDQRGLKERVELGWGRSTSSFRSGRPAIGMFGGSIEAPLPGLEALGAGARVPFSFDLALTGGGSLTFLPLGDETTVRIASAWPGPSFTGAFLPSERAVSAEGFTAAWKVPSMARPFPQAWRGAEVQPEVLYASSFGASLMAPVDVYQKVTRSVKYGALFLLLPFLVFFLFEVLGGLRVHPLQYLLVGLAECLFYLLLLSLAEHLPFVAAYLAAAGAATLMVSLYASAVLRSWRRGILLVPALAAAYGFLYATLQSEDYALLIGSVGLFAILGLVMVLTRSVDWYRVGVPSNGLAGPADGHAGPADGRAGAAAALPASQRTDSEPRRD
jgi:inner membrane protein